MFILAAVSAFFGKLSARALIVGITTLGILAILGLAYWHYTGLLDKVSALEADKLQLKTAVELQDRTISRQRTAIGEWQRHGEELELRMEELAEVARAAEEETRQLHEKFRKHDLGKIAREKPGLVERRVNDAADRARRMLECASGADRPDC